MAVVDKNEERRKKQLILGGTARATNHCCVGSDFFDGRNP